MTSYHWLLTQRFQSYVRYPLTVELGKGDTDPKKLFAEQCVLELVESDGSPQFDSTLFAQFANTWQSDHMMTLLHNPLANGLAELMVEVIKGLLTCVTYSG